MHAQYYILCMAYFKVVIPGILSAPDRYNFVRILLKADPRLHVCVHTQLQTKKNMTELKQ